MRSLAHAWYRRTPWLLLLAPLSGLYCAVIRLRRGAYRAGVLRHVRLPVPVIIVGNVTVGGTGKTPLTVWLARFLAEAGYRPGIVIRGYKGRARQWPQQVRADSDPYLVGDEPVLLARRCGCPVVAAPDRVAAGRMLIEAYPCDVVLSDDGLQHYALERDIEFAVIDGVRRLGNGFCLPAGPLREPGRRLSEVDFVVVNGAGERPEFPMRLRLLDACNLLDPRLRRPLDAFRGQPVHAVAGIGNPERFFSSLREAGLDVLAHPFRDHHPFRKDDLAFADDLPVLMTEKDAVKCHAFASPHHWYVPLEAELPDRLGRELLERLRTVRRPVANARES